jgi:hypothetical protein
MKVALGIILVTSSIAWLASPAEARWRLDLEGGAMVEASDVDVETGGGQASLDFDAGPAFAVGAGYELLRWLELDSHFQGGFANVDGLLADQLSFIAFTFGGRLFPFPWQRVRPWAGFEMGWYHMEVEDGLFSSTKSNQNQDSFGINVGGGLDVPVGSRVSLGVDVRYHNAFDAFEGVDFVTTLFNVAIWFGD